MEAGQLNLYLSEVHTVGTSLRRRVLNQQQTRTNLPARCSCRRTPSPKLKHIRVSSSVPSFGTLGASQCSVFNVDTVTKYRMSRKAMQVLDSKVKTGRNESKLLEVFRDALELDSFTLSAYDTAWVAMIPNDKMDGPLYPQTLEWISGNQRQDGAWEDESAVIPFDRIISTIACLMALKTWNSVCECSMKGEQFLEKALSIMKDEDLKFVSPGVFHALAEMMEGALRLGISLPYSSCIVKHLRTNHGRLLDTLTGNGDLIKTCPRRLLSFPEGLQHVISWNEILELQSAEGDLFSSPAATACLIMKTRDSKAMSYMNRLLEQFGSAVPNIYPKRPFHILSLIDHLERLNVNRHFHQEIFDVLDTLTRQWNLKTDEEIQDMVAEIVIFRVLREHGYSVLPETSVFAKCCSGLAEVKQLGASCMLELYRASELKFPGEEILDYAKDRSTTYLTTLLSETLENDQSNLTEEIKDLLDFPHFFKNRPVASMSYIDRFQFKDETKETYVERGFSRITHAGNPRLLAFAKSNFNSSQALYQKELQTLARWEEECRFMEVSFIRHVLSPSYITAVELASAPEMSLARACWTMNSVLTTAVDDLFDETSDLSELRLFVECVRRWDVSIVDNCSESLKIIARGLTSSLDYLSEEAGKLQALDVSHFFRRMWVDLVVSMMTEVEWAASGYTPTSDEYMDTSRVSFATGALVPLVVFFFGEVIADEDIENQEYWDLFLTSTTFGRLLNDSRTYQRDAAGDQVSAVSVHMREHSELTAEQSSMIINDMVKESASKALSKILNPSYSRSPVRSGWLGLMRALYMMYYQKVDGFSNTPVELKKKIKRFLFQPFPQDQL